MPADTTTGYAPRDLDWPWWLPLGSTVGALFVAVEALRHRAVAHGADVLAVDVPLMVLAVAPFVLDFVTHRHEQFFVPRLLWAAMTIAPVTALLIHSPTETDFAPFLVVLTCIQGGATARVGEGLAMLVVACGVLIGIEHAGEFDGTGIWVAGNIAAYAGGLAVQKSVAAVTAERARQGDLVAKAATDERQRIAREVHDVIAHSLSVTMLHLTGARHALETGADPTEAAQALRDAERLGRQAMNDIRRTVGLLAPDAGGDTAPMPGVADIGDLVAEFASAGLDVTWQIDGDPASVSLATGLGLYRIAQESLANIARHAPGASTAVRLVVSGTEARLVVSNAAANGAAALEGVPDVGGLGLRGMEERARLLGGAFRAGPDSGGWMVEVTTPLETPVT